MEKLVIWGASGQAKVLNEFISELGYQLIALIDKNPNISSPYNNIPLFHNLDNFQELNKCKETIYFSVAIGGTNGNVRMEIHNILVNAGLIPANLIHSTSFVANTVKVGSGVQILAKSAVCTEVIVGKQCIINTGATVDHEVILEDGVHICPGANVLGGVVIHKYATIGAGAVIFPKLEIGESSIVGAGSIVRHNVPPNCVVVGNPATILRKIEP